MVDAHLVRNHLYILSMAGALYGGLDYSTRDLPAASSPDAPPTLSIGGVLFVVKSKPAARLRRGHARIKAILTDGGVIPNLPDADGSVPVSCGLDQAVWLTD